MKSNLYKVTEQLAIYLKVAKDLNWSSIWESYKNKACGYIQGCCDSGYITEREAVLLNNVVVKTFDR